MTAVARTRFAAADRLRDLADAPTSAGIAVLAVAQVVQLGAIAGAGLVLVPSGPVAAACVAGVGIATRAVQSTVREALAARLRRRFVDDALARLVRRSALSPDPDLELPLFRALHGAVEVLSEDVPSLVGNAVAVVVLGGLALARVPWSIVPGVLLAALAGAGLYLAASVAHRQSLDRALAEDVRAYRGLGAFVRGRSELLAWGVVDERAAGVRALVEAWVAALWRASTLAGAGGRVPGAILAVAGAAGWLATYGGTGVSGAADLLVFASVVPAITGLGTGLVKLRVDLADVAVYADLPEGEADPGAAIGGTAPDLTGALRFDDVGFAYAGAPRRALNGLTFALAAGEVVAIVGPNGSGKSTALRLALRLADSAEGAVTLSGAPLSAVDARAWRRQVAYLPQRCVLGDGTVREAGAMFEALDATAFTGWLERLGVRSTLAARAAEPLDAAIDGLSAGERQKVALARVFASSRPVLLLDEPEANLDDDGKRRLIEALRDRSDGRRVLVCAHDPAVIACAHRVVDARVRP